MSIFTILMSMREKPQNKELNTQLIKALTSMHDNTVLNLSEENFGSDNILLEPEDITNLFGALRESPIVVRLTLKANQISEAGMSALTDAIDSSLKVKQLDLEYTQINDASVTAVTRILLENLDMTEFHFNDSSMDDAETHMLAEFIRSMESRLMIPSISTDTAENNHIELDNAYISHYNRMHQRAVTLGEALHPQPLPVTVATLIGEYSSVVTTPTLLHAFQNKIYIKTPVKLEIKPNTIKVKTVKASKQKSKRCAIL